MPDGVSVAVLQMEKSAEFVVSGLRGEQHWGLLPELTRAVMITVAEEKSQLRAGLMRSVRRACFRFWSRLLPV